MSLSLLSKVNHAQIKYFRNEIYEIFDDVHNKTKCESGFTVQQHVIKIHIMISMALPTLPFFFSINLKLQNN